MNITGLKEGRVKLAEFGQEVPEATAKLIEGTSISTEQLKTWGTLVAQGGEGGKTAMAEVAEAINGVDDATLKNQLGVAVWGTLFEDQGQNIIDVLIGAKDETYNLQDGVQGVNEKTAQMNADPAVEMKQALSDMMIALTPVFTKITEVVTKISEWVSKNPELTATITAIVAVIGILVGIFMALVPIITTITALAGVLGVSVGAIAAPVLIVIGVIMALIGIGGLLISHWDEIKAKTIEIWGSISEWFSNFWELTKAAFQIALDLIVGFVSEKFNEAKGLITTIWNSIKSFFTETLGGIWETVKGKFSDIVNSVREKMKEVLSKIEEIWGEVTGFFEGIDLFEMGSDIIQGLIDGVKSMASSVLNSVTGVVDGAIEGAKKLLGIKSPSRVFMEIGEYTGEGFQRGLLAMTNDIQKASDKMVSASIPTIPTVQQSNTQSANNNLNVNIAPANVVLDKQSIGTIVFEVVKELNQMDNSRIRRFGGEPLA